MKFLQYALSLSPSVLSLPIMGHLNNYDIYNRVVTVAGTPQWLKPNDLGFGFLPQTNGRYSIAHGVEQIFPSDQTIFVYLSTPYISNGNTQYLASKYDGAASCSWVLYTVSNTLRLFDSTLVSQNGSNSTIGVSSFASVSISNTSVEFFFDGVSNELLGGLDYSAQKTWPIIAGTSPTGTLPCNNPIAGVAIFPSALTDEQISNLHLLFSQMVVGYQPKTKLYIPRVDTKGAVLDIWGDPNQNNIIADKSGNSNDGTVSGRISSVNDTDRIAYVTYAGGNPQLRIAPSSSINNLANTTLIFNGLKVKSSGESPWGSISSRGNNYYYFYTSGINMNIASVRGYTDGAAGWIATIGNYNRNMQLIIAHQAGDPSNLPVIFVNGIEVAVTNSTPRSGSLVADAGFNLDLLGGTIRDTDLELQQYKHYPSILSADDLRDEYLKFALGHVRRLTPRFEHPVTLAAVTAPGHVGPWSLHNISGEWLDDGSERYFRYTLSNTRASVSNNQAYGAWYFKINLISNSGYPLWKFVCNDPKVTYTGATESGYGVSITPSQQLQLFEMSSGTLIDNTVVSYVPSSGEIEFFITRQVIDGLITVYTREANHTTWTVAMSGTDNTVTISKYFGIDCVFGNAEVYTYSNLLCFPYGDALTPSDVPEIAD